MVSVEDTPFAIFLVALLVIVTGVTCFFIGANSKSAPVKAATKEVSADPRVSPSPILVGAQLTPSPASSPSSSAAPAATPKANETSKWTIYRSNDYDYSFKLPKELTQIPRTLSFKNAAGHPLVHVEQYKGNTAQANYDLNCASTTQPEATPPMTGKITGYREFPDHTCWMFGTSLFLNVYNRDESDSNKPALSETEFRKIIATFQVVK